MKNRNTNLYNEFNIPVSFICSMKLTFRDKLEKTYNKSASSVTNKSHNCVTKDQECH